MYMDFQNNIIDGKNIADTLCQEIAKQVSQSSGRPCMGVIIA